MALELKVGSEVMLTTKVKVLDINGAFVAGSYPSFVSHGIEIPGGRVVLPTHFLQVTSNEDVLPIVPLVVQVEKLETEIPVSKALVEPEPKLEPVVPKKVGRPKKVVVAKKKVVKHKR